MHLREYIIVSIATRSEKKSILQRNRNKFIFCIKDEPDLYGNKFKSPFLNKKIPKCQQLMEVEG